MSCDWRILTGGRECRRLGGIHVFYGTEIIAGATSVKACVRETLHDGLSVGMRQLSAPCDKPQARMSEIGINRHVLEDCYLCL